MKNIIDIIKDMNNKYEFILGRWDLISHGYFDDNNQFHPTSEYISGILLYSSDKSMSVLIVKKPTVQQVSDIIAYSGRFRIEENKIYHMIDLSLYEQRNHSEEIRFYTLEDNTLVLKAESPDGKKFEIKWCRNKKSHAG